MANATCNDASQINFNKHQDTGYIKVPADWEFAVRSTEAS